MSDVKAATEKLEPFTPGAGHIHELTDRSHCLNTMFEELIATHPAATLIPKEIEAVRIAVNDMYQAIGAIHCADEEAKPMDG